MTHSYIFRAKIQILVNDKNRMDSLIVGKEKCVDEGILRIVTED